MPLPSQKYGAKQCTARSKRSGVRCLNNAVTGATICRMHGHVPKDKVKRGKGHPGYRDGSRTLEAQRLSSEQSARLSQYEDALHLLGMASGKLSRGRKANGYCKIKSVDEIKKVIK